jgi:hypothetical protein
MHRADLEMLGKHSTSRSCLYIKRLGDVDEAVLRRILARSYATTKARRDVSGRRSDAGTSCK